MGNIFNLIRHYDFQFYYQIYILGVHSPRIAYFYYFFARYGIVFFFLSFIYLIWRKKIGAFLCALLAMGFAGLVNLIVLFFWQRPWAFMTYAKLIIPNAAASYLDNSAFPSSHTYIAFAIATSVFLYGHKKLGPILYILAIFVALGRVGVGLHYPSDVIAGAILGILSGIIVYYIVRKYEQARKLTEI